MMESRWMGEKEAAEYLNCSVATIKRHINAGILNWHLTGTGFKRLDREQIDAMFFIPERPAHQRGVVTAEDERRFIIPKEKRAEARKKARAARAAAQ